MATARRRKPCAADAPFRPRWCGSMPFALEVENEIEEAVADGTSAGSLKGSGRQWKPFAQKFNLCRRDGYKYHGQWCSVEYIS